MLSPAKVIDVALPVTLAATPPGLEVTVYEVIGAPPLLAGAAQLTPAEALPADALTAVGAVGTAAGVVTAFDGADAAPGPTELVAFTVKVYVVALLRPVTMTLVPDVVAVTPPGDDVTMYVSGVAVEPLMPSHAGRAQLTVAEALPAVAVAPVGASATLDGAS